MDSVVVVMRRPCLPEDEGRYFHAGTFTKREDAELWIEKQEGNYFHPRDYCILEGKPVSPQT